MSARRRATREAVAGVEAARLFEATNTATATRQAGDADLFFTDTHVSGRKRPRAESSGVTASGSKIYVRPTKPERVMSRTERRVVDAKATRVVDDERHATKQQSAAAAEVAMRDLWDEADGTSRRHSRNFSSSDKEKSRALISVPPATSYNPSVEVHQQALAKAVRVQERLDDAAVALVKAAVMGVSMPKPSQVLVEESDEEGEGGAKRKDTPLRASLITEPKVAISLSRRDRLRVAKGKKPRAPSTSGFTASPGASKRPEPVFTDADLAVVVTTSGDGTVAVARPRAARDEMGGLGTFSKSKDRLGRRKSYGGSSHVPLSLPLSEELAGSMRLMKPTTAGAIVSEQLASLIEGGLVPRKTTGRKGKDTGKRRFKMVEFPRKPFEMPAGDAAEEA